MSVQGALTRISGADRDWIRRLFAAFVLLHGLAHLSGVVLFSRAADGESAEYLTGRWVISNPIPLSILGAVWVLFVVAFAITACAIWLDAKAWRPLLAVVAVGSLLLTIAGVWAAVVGAVISFGLLVVACRSMVRGRSAEKRASLESISLSKGAAGVASYLSARPTGR